MSDVKLPSIPDDCTLEWVNGVLTLVKKDYNEQLSDHTFQVGEKAILARDTVFEQGMGLCSIAAGNEVEIISATHLFNNLYKIKFQNATTVIHGCDLCKIPARQQSAIELIKTFADAVEWCENHGKKNLVIAYNELSKSLPEIPEFADLFAYFKLRIITIALNEGWELVASKDSSESYWIPVLDCDEDEDTTARSVPGRFGDSAQKLCFKSREVAECAGKKFKDIYGVFCGVKKSQCHDI